MSAKRHPSSMSPKEALEAISDAAGFAVGHSGATDEDIAFIEEAEKVLAGLVEQLEAAQNLCRELYDVFYPHLDESERIRLRAVVDSVAPDSTQEAPSSSDDAVPRRSL